MTFKKLSLEMGKSRTFLSAYCYYNGIKGKTPHEVLAMVEDRINHQQKVINDVQEMHYYLVENRIKTKFSKHLEAKNIVKHGIQLFQVINCAFIVEREQLMKRTQIEKMEKILKCFSEYKNPTN